MQRKQRHSISDTVKNGFAWMVIFTVLFFLFCKWISGA